MNSTDTKIAEGKRVRLLQNVDRFPHFVARKGITGTVTEVTDQFVSVKMDDHIDGAEEWDNEIVWDANANLEWINEDVEVVA